MRKVYYSNIQRFREVMYRKTSQTLWNGEILHACVAEGGQEEHYSRP